MESAQAPQLYLVRDPEPLGAFFRAGGRDFMEFSNVLAAGLPGGGGVVVEGRSLRNPHLGEVREAARRAGMEFVIDSNGVELASPEGWRLSGIKEMPWVPRKRYVATPWTADERRLLVTELARAAVEHHATSILAPARYFDEIERDDLAHDVETAVALRAALNAAGGRTIRIYYPLATSLQLLASTTARGGILAVLREGRRADAFDALWVRAARYDMAAGPTSIRRYINGVRGLHDIGVPVFGDRAGTAGLGMVALGVISGVTSGITFGERFDAAALFRVRTGNGFGMAPRVYVPAIGAFMKPASAEALLRHPSVKSWFACQRPCCSARGLADTVGEPRRHFIVTRAGELRDLAQVPAGLRPAHYMEKWLRPASDRATKAMQLDPTLESHRKHLDGLRSTLAAVIEEDAATGNQVSRSPIRMDVRRGA